MPGRTSTRLGLLLGLGAATGSALGVIPYKLATREADPAHVVVILMVAAASFNTLASLPGLLGSIRRHRAGDRSASVVPPAFSLRVTLWAALWLGLLAAVANYTGSEAVGRLDAAVAALLIQMQVLFAALVGWLWLGERVSARFVLGALLAVAGVGSMHLGTDVSVRVHQGMIWGISAAACFGSMQVVVRRYIHRIQPMWTNAMRLWLAVLLVAAVPGSLAGALGCSPRVVLLASTSALCGPLMGRLMLMYSARHVPAATSTLLGLCTPVLALGADWALLDTLPEQSEWLGGLVVVLGMLLAMLPGRSPRVEAPERAVA